MLGLLGPAGKNLPVVWSPYLSPESKNRVLDTLCHGNRERPAFTSNKHVNGAAEASTVDTRVFARVRGLGLFLNPLMVLIFTHLIDSLESPSDEGGVDTHQPDCVTSFDD